MHFAHSRFTAAPAVDEPLRWGRVLTLALVLTGTAASAALLVDAEGLEHAIAAAHRAAAHLGLAASAEIAPRS